MIIWSQIIFAPKFLFLQEGTELIWGSVSVTGQKQCHNPCQRQCHNTKGWFPTSNGISPPSVLHLLNFQVEQPWLLAASVTIDTVRVARVMTHSMAKCFTFTNMEKYINVANKSINWFLHVVHMKCEKYFTSEG